MTRESGKNREISVRKTVRKAAKIRSGAESLSVSEAAAALGISAPTVKRMVAEDRLESFRTPGGHLRITAESIKAVREQRQAQPRPVREASPVLQNRRERLEELTLEAQEHRARRDLEKMRREEQEEAERREAEAEDREEEAAQRDAELKLERERLEQERARLEYDQAQEPKRIEREQAHERQRQQAEQQLTAFRCRWQEKAGEAVAAYEYRWLSATQRKEILEGLEAEIAKRQPTDDPRMGTILARSLEALVEPFRAARDAQEKRQRLLERALISLPYGTTDAERARATTAIREALQQLDGCADECEMRVAVQEAVEPVCLAVQKRLLDARLLDWTLRELPWSRTDRDEARIRRECAEILAELPLGATEAEGKEALEPIVREACAEIENRQAEKDRQTRKANLIQQGVAEVWSYLLELKREGEISDRDIWDSEFTADLKDAVRRGLEGELTGDETTKEIRELARAIIDSEIQ
jgi:excisionase family DNA binding protein